MCNVCAQTSTPADAVHQRPSAQLAAQRMRREAKQELLEQARREYMEEARRLNRRLKDDEISVGTWQSEMMDLVKDVNVAGYTSGKSGDWDSMSFEDWGRAGRVIRDQYDFVRRWARELRVDGVDSASLAELNNRASLYADAASQTFDRGYQSEIGVDPGVLPAQPGDGTTECYARCKCRWAFWIIDKARGDFNATWKLGNAEHCRTCRRRAREWKKLKIRGGRLVSEISRDGTFR